MLPSSMYDVLSQQTVDLTFQNLDSSEISLTDVSHYFDRLETVTLGIRVNMNYCDRTLIPTSAYISYISNHVPTPTLTLYLLSYS